MKGLKCEVRKGIAGKEREWDCGRNGMEWRGVIKGIGEMSKEWEV